MLRVLLFPLSMMMLVACNLSTSATLEPRSLQVIITATPLPRLESEDQSDEVIEVVETDVTTAIETFKQTVSDNVVNVAESDLYYVRGNRPQNQCAIQATVTTNIRTSASLSAEVVGQLVGGEWVAISRLMGGWYQIDLTNTPVHRMWISSEPTILDSLCRCDANGCSRRQTIPTPIDNGLFMVGNPLPGTPNECYVFTAGDFNVNIRASQSETSPILGQLYANHWLPVQHFINGWFGIDLPGTPVDGAYVASGPVQLVSNCLCTDTSCTVRPDAGICDLTTHANTLTSIYTEPSNWSQQVGELLSTQVYRAVAQSTSGWYQLERGGWVPSNYLQLLSPDDCRALPKITYDAPIFECQVVNTTEDILTLVKQPDGDYYGRFWPDHHLGIIARDGKWLQVYVPAFESAAWVDSTGLMLSGLCGDFQ